MHSPPVVPPSDSGPRLPNAGISSPSMTRDPPISISACATVPSGAANRMISFAPSACVYLDDLGINCKPASQLGMHAIKVTSGEQALADLSAALGMELP